MEIDSCNTHLNNYSVNNTYNVSVSYLTNTTINKLLLYHLKPIYDYEMFLNNNGLVSKI